MPGRKAEKTALKWKTHQNDRKTRKVCESTAGRLAFGHILFILTTFIYNLPYFSASSGGLFAGLLFLIAALVSIGIHSFFSQHADSDGALLVFRLSDMALFCCTLIGCTAGLIRYSDQSISLNHFIFDRSLSINHFIPIDHYQSIILFRSNPIQ